MKKAFAVVVAILFCAFTGMATASAESAVTAKATVNGHTVTGADANDPVRLVPNQPADIAIEVSNNGDYPIDVSQVELAGRVLGLNFFTYATTVDLTVQPGSTGVIRYQLDLSGLRGQATGLMGGQLTVKGSLGQTVATMPLVTDVRGSLFSVYGVFGIALFVLTVFALIDASIGIARHRLSTNRMQRGLRLLVPGIGIGLMLVFSASVARLWVPDTARWLILAALSAAIFFAIGFLAPVPRDEDDLDYEDIDVDVLTEEILTDSTDDDENYHTEDLDVDALTDGHTEDVPEGEFAK